MSFPLRPVAGVFPSAPVASNEQPDDVSPAIDALGDRWDPSVAAPNHLPVVARRPPALCRTTHEREGPVRRVERYAVQIPSTMRVPYHGACVGAFPEGMPLALTSGITFAGCDPEGRWLFKTITDRGPNGDAPKFRDASGLLLPTKVFAAPDYTPSINTVRIRSGCRADCVSQLRLHKDGAPISGRPLPPGTRGTTGEVPLSDRLEVLPYDPDGLDPEGIALDRDGNFWIVDEYGPFLVHVDAANGNILDKLGPGDGLPDEVRKRLPNRGFEGCAVTPGGTVLAIVQSPMFADRERAGVAVVAFDPATRTSRLHEIPLDPTCYKKLSDAKIGDIAAIDERHLLVIDQGVDRDGKMQNWIARIDLEAGTLRRIIDLRTYGWSAEKAEGLAIIDDETLIVGNDNDFGIQGKLASGNSLSDVEVNTAGALSRNRAALDDTYRVEPMPDEQSTSELWVLKLRGSIDPTQSLAPPIDTTPAKIAVARELASRVDECFQRLIPTCGFESFAAYSSALDRIRNPAFQALRTFLRDRVQLALAVPAKVRMNVLERGFLNQHETGASLKGGLSNPELRNWLEAGLLGLSREEHSRLPGTVKPKYFFLRGDDALYRYPVTVTYGDDFWIVDPRKAGIEDRLLFSPNGDSLLSVGARSVDPDRPALQPKRWTDMLVPWRYRELALPGMFLYMSENPKLQEVGITDYSPHMMAKYLDAEDLAQLAPFRHPGSVSRPYFEAPVLGPLFTDGVVSLIPRAGVPTRAEGEAFAARGIPLHRRETGGEWSTLKLEDLLNQPM